MALLTFSYTARTETGTVKKGMLSALNAAEATKQLKNQGLVVTHVELEKQKPAFASIERWLSKFSRVSLTERAIFTQNLQIMVKSGISLSQSLGTLAAQTRSKAFAKKLLEMKGRVEKGEAFAKVLASYPQFFSEVYVSMIAGGEASGKLEAILAELAKQMKKERLLISKVRSAMMYPLVVTTAMIAIGIAMMIFVIPKISGIYLEMGAKLPLPTRILIGVSNFILHNGVLVAGGLVALFFLLARVLRTRRGKRFFHTVWLHIPIFGVIIKKINLARFSRTLTALLQTDIPIVQSFQIIERTLSNVLYQEAMAAAAQSLKKGVTVVEALRSRPKLFPPLVTQMISVGEESGTLDELSGEIATFYEEDVDETMTNFSSIIEPVLLLILGLGVGAMAISILLPIYTLSEQI